MKKRKLLAVTLLSTILLNSAAPLVVADTSLRNNTSSTDQPTTADTDTDDESETAKKDKKSKETASQHDTQKDHKPSYNHPTPPSNDTKQTDQASSEATDKPNKDKNDTKQPDSSDQSTPSPKDQSSQKESQNKDGRPTPSPDQQKDQTPDKTPEKGPEKAAEKTPEPNRDAPKPIQPPLGAAAPVFAPWRESDKDLSKLKPSSRSSAAYVRHWTGDSAYTHNLLSRRYGITAEQLDGFLNSLGIHYDKERLNGKRLLEWEKLTGLDVRAIVAIAMAESSLGTQGVAKEKGSNMFGYGAFDFNPNNAKKYSDEVAIRHMVEDTIIANKNQTFERQDLKAKKWSLGQLDTLIDGGVYFTDTSGSGQRRADIMTKLDQWIDDHGNTPDIPEHLKITSGTQFSEVPVGYKRSQPQNVLTYKSETYSFGQCTWYAYNRVKELGYQVDRYMGNGGDWQRKPGFVTTHKPKVGYVVSFAPGQAGADATYGHVAVVEQIKEDGSILISESNVMGLGTISYRTFTAEQASLLTYVVGDKLPRP
ncbi:immunogenic secreted protein [Streptococcus pyogenes JRS4]|uniref:Immunogenic secreted protein n=1 Tax=Streptococcus pyogenes TaxID=1314 RepID=Q54707_STRPY|nr:CHAP domain-containing protein [Streptococcus pyogenes]ESA45072.1 CHAP domain protein [Streptococcus pyogenes GA19700]ESA46443.1 CHAP domain protein [Streptococcus pyogenes GA41039]ESA49423.1 CHAP domain protein [Streptococcus pyogenes GA41208]HER4585885.1 CHAP domain-containing protein [Streptococcus pyogenes NGAS618]HER4612996.1 CHAP domain-containing protein [Streptococcus pyogenes NGAS603]HER4744571.1 CHAP domain-containing protein [Streptococcus pyogenes NGAS289]HER4749680.1 CHAP dom